MLFSKRNRTRLIQKSMYETQADISFLTFTSFNSKQKIGFLEGGGLINITTVLNVYRAFDAFAALVEHVCIYHRCPNALMAQ